MNPKEIHISDYNYPLSDERIAKFPLPYRDHSKLLVYRHGEVTEDLFYNLPHYLPKGALMVFNNTRVIQARFHFRKATASGDYAGALIEVFLLEPAEPADYEQMFQTTSQCTWQCLVGNAKKWKTGTLTRQITVKGQSVLLSVERGNPSLGGDGDGSPIRFSWVTHPSEGPEEAHAVSFADILDIAGELPIPPYLNRATQESDKTTYQTVYSKIKGSVAAPTAGLHFTNNVLQALDEHGIEREELTLHVGAGTFRPVKSELIADHPMHTEYISVKRQTIERLIQHDAQAVAVGTTSVRTLESLYYMGCRLARNPHATEAELHIDQWEPYGSIGENWGDKGTEVRGTPRITPLEALQHILDWLDCNHKTTLHSSTQIIIAPGYEYKIVRALVTNFHQPQSTLLLLVSAFVNGDWHTIYDYALAHDFRFLSYGDSSLLIP